MKQNILKDNGQVYGKVNAWKGRLRIETLKGTKEMIDQTKGKNT